MTLDSVRDPAIQALLDKQAIREVTMRYCRGVDRCDVPLVNSVYFDDALDVRMDHTTTGNIIGANLVRSLREGMVSTCHHITTQVIELHGDLAACESYFIGTHALTSGGRMTSVGRYIDRLERREDVWKIAHRQVVHELLDVTPPPTEMFSAGHTSRARRDESDPSYLAFEEIRGAS